MNAEQAKFLADHYANLMQFEFPTTCKVLAAVKDETRDYKPDEKSRTAWELATHLATADVWFLDSVINGRFEFDPEAAKQAESQFKTVKDVVSFYEKTFPEKLRAVQALPPEKLTQIVDFFGMFKWPVVSYLGFANNHGIHHRGQLAAYLRALGSKVPAIYGGSADEPMQVT
jgi:uncharacterized damage-inducible protein DinB